MGFFDKINPFKLDPEAQAELDAFKDQLNKDTQRITSDIKKRSAERIKQMNAEHSEHNRQKALEIKENAFIEVSSKLEEITTEINNITKFGVSDKVNNTVCNNIIKIQIMAFENSLETIVNKIKIYGKVDQEFMDFLQENHKKLLQVAEAKRKEFGIK